MTDRHFVVMGEPVAKGRPRFSVRHGRYGSYVNVHTPEKTAAYEDLIKLEYMTQCRMEPLSKEHMLRLKIMAYFSIPKSASKVKKASMESHEIRPTKKPDADNVLKCVSDALNHVAYHDDSQIVEAVVEKYYSVQPRIEVSIDIIDKAE